MNNKIEDLFQDVDGILTSGYGNFDIWMEDELKELFSNITNENKLLLLERITKDEVVEYTRTEMKCLKKLLNS